MTKRRPKPPGRPPREPTRGYTPAHSKKPAAKAAAKSSASASNKVVKTQLVEMVANRTGLTKKKSEEAISAMLDAVVSSIKSGQSVGLPGLGTLTVKSTAARVGVRPGTSEKIQIPAGKKVAFKVSALLKDEL